MKPERFNGSFSTSSFKYQSHGIESFDLQVDNVSLPNFPMQMRAGIDVDFYLNYLRTTGRFENCFASGAITSAHFTHSNFLLFIDLKSENLTTGQCTLKIKFETLTTDNLYCIYMPVTEKHISFDMHMNPTLNNFPLKS